MMNRVVDIGRWLSKKEQSRNGRRSGLVSLLMMVIDGDADRDVVGRSRARNDDVSTGRNRSLYLIVPRQTFREKNI